MCVNDDTTICAETIRRDGSVDHGEIRPVCDRHRSAIHEQLRDEFAPHLEDGEPPMTRFEGFRYLLVAFIIAMFVLVSIWKSLPQ